MSELYNHKVVEKKWQKVWDDNKAFAATDDYSKPKYYALVEFPYPSGQGLHVGHPRPYTALDIVARKRRMQGYNVLYPMGWDAFGLPTENYAIKNKIHPKIVTENNVKRFKEQLHSLGYSFDWDREINTTDPSYYKWTQWIFLKLFKAGLAYKKEMPINWCTSCKVGLANEEVVNGVCERCGAPVVRKVKSESRYPRRTGSANPRAPRWISPSRARRISFVYTRPAAIHCLVLLTWLYPRSIRSSTNTRMN